MKNGRERSVARHLHSIPGGHSRIHGRRMDRDVPRMAGGVTAKFAAGIVDLTSESTRRSGPGRSGRGPRGEGRTAARLLELAKATNRCCGRGQRHRTLRRARSVDGDLSRPRSATQYGPTAREGGSERKRQPQHGMNFSALSRRPRERGSTFRECLPRIDDAKSHGFRRDLFPADPSDRAHQSERAQQLVTSEPGEPGVPYAIGIAK